MIFEQNQLPKNSYIIVDSREGKRGDNVRDYFGEENTRVEQLHSADYVLVIGGKKQMGIEYKKDSDMVSSIMGGRIFKQVQDMINEYPMTYVMIEGDMREYINKLQYFNTKLSFSWNNWLGAKSSLLQATKLDYGNVEYECIVCMDKLFTKGSDNRDRTHTNIKKYKNPAKTWISNIDGLALKTATKVTTELNLNTLEDLLSLEKEDLLGIKGIKDAKATKIMESIK